MSVAIDANVAAAVILPLPYSDQAVRHITTWKREDIGLLAPMLLEYEVGAILRKAVVAGWLTARAATDSMTQVRKLNIQCLPLTLALHERALAFASRLGQSKTYDAHYLAVAEDQGVELWTADNRLANGARRAGIVWVRWIGDAVASAQA